MPAQIIGAALEQSHFDGGAERAREHRHVAAKQLVLQRARPGRDDDAASGQERRHEIGEGLAGAGSRLDDQRFAQGECTPDRRRHGGLLRAVGITGNDPRQRAVRTEYFFIVAVDGDSRSRGQGIPTPRLKDGLFDNGTKAREGHRLRLEGVLEVPADVRVLGHAGRTQLPAAGGDREMLRPIEGAATVDGIAHLCARAHRGVRRYSACAPGSQNRRSVPAAASSRYCGSRACRTPHRRARRDRPEPARGLDVRPPSPSPRASRDVRCRPRRGGSGGPRERACRTPATERLSRFIARMRGVYRLL